MGKSGRVVDFDILNKPRTVDPEIVDDDAFAVAEPDPFDLDTLKSALVPFEKEVGKMV